MKQAEGGLEFQDLSASPSQGLGLQACASMPGFVWCWAGTPCTLGKHSVSYATPHP